MNDATEQAEGTPPSRRQETLELFGNRAFRSLWFCGGINSTMRWLESLATGVFVFDLTDSPLTVAFVLFARWVPLVLFGAVMGALADRVDRRRIMIAGFSTAAVSSAVLGVLVVTGAIEVWHIALGAFVNGSYTATDYPTRRTMIGEIAGAERIGVAMAFDSLTNNGTRMLGPALGGLLLATTGLQGVYFLGMTLFAVGGLLAFSVVHRRLVPPTTGTHILANLLDGFRYVRTQPVVLGTLAVTVAVNMFGFPFATMVPVIGRDILGLGAFPVGLLSSAEGGGAFIGALIVAALVRPHHYKVLFLAGATLFISGVLVFALSGSIEASFAALVVGGFGVAGFSAMQSTLLMSHVPPEIRGRVMGVLTMSIGTMPLGILHVGLLADWFGPQAALTTVAVEGLALMAAIVVWWRRRG